MLNLISDFCIHGFVLYKSKAPSFDIRIIDMNALKSNRSIFQTLKYGNTREEKPLENEKAHRPK